MPDDFRVVGPDLPPSKSKRKSHVPASLIDERVDRAKQYPGQWCVITSWTVPSTAHTAVMKTRRRWLPPPEGPTFLTDTETLPDGTFKTIAYVRWPSPPGEAETIELQD